MAPQGAVLLRHALQHLRTQLLAGVLVVVPIGITAFILKLVFDALDGLFSNIAKTFTNDVVDVPTGVGIGGVIVLTYLVGLLVTNVLGRYLVERVTQLLEQVPVVKSIYTAVKGVVEAFSGRGKVKFNRVVILDWPRPGVKSLGFVTGQVVYRGSQRMLTIYLPTTPNPTSGFLAIVPEEAVMNTTMTVEEGVKMLLSGGIIAPESIEVAGATPEEAPVKPG